MSTYYYTLVASLPALPLHFDSWPIPVTAATLRSRLSMLDDPHRNTVQQLSDFFRWDRQPRDHSDADVIAKQRRLGIEIRNPLVARLVRHRFEMRTLVAAVRSKRAGDSVPELPDFPLSAAIRRHWDQPYFGLNVRYSWLVRFCQALDDHQPSQAQRHLFAELWDHWRRIDQLYHFSFESIVLYLARWEILSRWASQNTELGKQRFDGLVDSILRKEGAALLSL
ncbi:hypothetical protein [Novipirellula artificiosorum]|uniref:DUF2764 domain-containing protein n=1 Tax=Novipirellula artificiosorum TaxID=2528016 RepID=A0A5C6D5N6_9BACT|nr:hypothetical protein [Novipirellula artificiosorum]TWU32463.1 hypothetical protein Poly41_54410 [Novipirellula artificiosorum]